MYALVTGVQTCALPFCRLGVPDVVDGVESLPGRLPLPDIEMLSPVRAARPLLDARTQRLADLVRRHPDDLEWDDRDYPAVRGMILATGLSDEQIVRLRSVGFNPVREAIDALGLGYVRLQTPDDTGLGQRTEAHTPELQ